MGLGRCSTVPMTFLAGVIIYRHLPEDALWVIGLLIGLEMLFNGWMWIMLSIGLARPERRIGQNECPGARRLIEAAATRSDV